MAHRHHNLVKERERDRQSEREIAWDSTTDTRGKIQSVRRVETESEKSSVNDCAPSLCWWTINHNNKAMRVGVNVRLKNRGCSREEEKGRRERIRNRQMDKNYVFMHQRMRNHTRFVFQSLLLLLLLLSSCKDISRGGRSIQDRGTREPLLQCPFKIKLELDNRDLLVL